jgi:hypothetical protein
VSFGAVEVLSRAITEIAPLDLDILVAVGPEGEPGEAVQALLGDCPERQVAARLRDEIAAMPAPDEVVPALVELAGG